MNRSLPTYARTTLPPATPPPLPLKVFLPPISLFSAAMVVLLPASPQLSPPTFSAAQSDPSSRMPYRLASIKALSHLHGTDAISRVALHSPALLSSHKHIPSCKKSRRRRARLKRRAFPRLEERAAAARDINQANPSKHGPTIGLQIISLFLLYLVG